MTTVLKINLIIVMILFLIYVFRSIKKNKLSTKNALIWITADIIVIFCIVFVEKLLLLANFIGIETVSNMMFFIGFIYLLILCFNLTNELSLQNKKIIKLTQELGILKNQINKEKDKNDK